MDKAAAHPRTLAVVDAWLGSVGTALVKDRKEQQLANLTTLVAQVNAGNPASHRLFERCGYVPQSTHYARRM